MKKEYVSPEIETTELSEIDVLNDGYSGFWAGGVDFDELIRALAIGTNTYKE